MLHVSLPEIKSQWFNQWLALTGGSESPPLFNFWSGVSAIAACLGRRWTLKLGRFTYTPNMYVILTGPPAVRKSSAGDIAQRILRRYTDVKFGPNDTAGQRQGLIASFINSYHVDDESATASEASADTIMQGIDDWLNKPSKSAAGAGATEKKRRRILRPDGSSPPSDLFIFADELGTFIGMNQLELVNCLTDLFYPKATYEYALARSSVVVERPGLNLLACTTPTSLTTHLPPTAIGQGFSSRAVFVYCGVPGKKIFPAPPLDEALEQILAEQLARLYNSPDTEMTVTPSAMELIGDIYHNYETKLEDSRFTHYEQRRIDHLTKLCMVIAAADGATSITDQHVRDAHLMLSFTEQDMPNALGELGMTKQALARQHLKDMIENSWPHGLALNSIKLNMARDLTARELNDVLLEYEQRGICVITDVRDPKGGNGYKVVIPVIQEKKLRAEKTREARDATAAQVKPVPPKRETPSQGSSTTVAVKATSATPSWMEDYPNE